MDSPVSPLRQIPARFGDDQVLLFDGVRYCIAAAELSYLRAVQTAATISLSVGLEQREEDKGLIPVLASDIWTTVDALSRLRLLLATLKGASSLNEVKAYQASTRDVADARDLLQHYNEAVTLLTASGAPVWGSFSWYFAMAGPPPVTRAIVVAAGAARPGMNAKLVVQERGSEGIDHLTIHTVRPRLSKRGTPGSALAVNLSRAVRLLPMVVSAVESLIQPVPGEVRYGSDSTVAFTMGDSE